FHPWAGMQKCDKPERWRWGKAPRDYRGLRKVWVAEDLSRRNRTQIKPAQVVKTPIAVLGLTGVIEQPSDGGTDGGTAAAGCGQACGCLEPGAKTPSTRAV